MKTYISIDNFYTNGFKGEEVIITGVIKGLEFKVLKEIKDIIYLQNINTGTIIMVTKAMLASPLFLEKERNYDK